MTPNSPRSVRTMTANCCCRRRGRSPWFADRYAEGADWRAMAYWIHNHLPYTSLEFFPKLAAFNISWHEKPKRAIHSFIRGPGVGIAQGEGPRGDLASVYAGFPDLRRE